MKPGKQIGKNLAIYLGTAWVSMEALNFFIERYPLEPLLLDILIILLVFGVPSTIVFSSFKGRLNKLAVVLQIVIGIVSFISVGYFVTHPLNLNPRSLRFAPINQYISPLRDLNSVAVMPIYNNLPNKENEYLLAGLHDGIITELGKLGTIKTISRTSTLPYAVSAKTLKKIGKELDVSSILESSFSTSKDGFVLRTRLLDTRNEELLWFEEFETTLNEMPELFETVAQIIATRLDPSAIENVRVHEDVNPEVYKEIVKGNSLLQNFTGNELKEALMHFQRAIDIDSGSFEGNLGMAYAWIYLQQLGIVDPKVARPNIFKYSEIAQKIEPHHWRVYQYKGIKSFYIDYEFPIAIENLNKSLELNPNNSDTRSMLAHEYMITGDWQNAWRQMRYAKEIDPLNPQVLGFEFIMYTGQNKMLSAMKSMEILGALDPDNYFYKMFSTVKNRDFGNDEASIEWLKLMYEGVTINPLEISQFIDRKFEETKDVNKTWYAFIKHLKTINIQTYYPSMTARILYSFLQDYDSELFFESFNQMVEDRHPDLPYYSMKDGNPLQNDPRYIQAMIDLGFWQGR